MTHPRIETPFLPKDIFGKDFENVYEPAEDTFLLLDALEKDLISLSEKVQICLECGSGSGTVITALSKAFPDTLRLMLATDINEEACKTTKKCAKFHNQNGIQVIRTNLADALVDRLENKVDLLLFNPPYVPTDDEELKADDFKGKIYLSWAGGNKGRKLIDDFLRLYVPRLMSKPDGVAYMVALEQNCVNNLSNYLSDYNIEGSVVMQRRAGIELLHIIKYEWVDRTTDLL